MCKTRDNEWAYRLGAIAEDGENQFAAALAEAFHDEVLIAPFCLAVKSGVPKIIMKAAKQLLESSEALEVLKQTSTKKVER